MQYIWCPFLSLLYLNVDSYQPKNFTVLSFKGSDASIAVVYDVECPY